LPNLIIGRLIAVPAHALEAEQSLALRRGNSAFWTPCPAQAFRLCRLLQDGDELPTSGKALVPVEPLLEENMETGKRDSGDGKETSLERKVSKKVAMEWIMEVLRG